MSTSLRAFAAAVASALEDPAFAAAVGELVPTRSPAAPTLDVAEAAAYLHLPATTVRQYAREGRLPAYKAGRQWLFFRDELDQAVRGNLLAA
jgi:excisionase family DNA binding protein